MVMVVVMVLVKSMTTPHVFFLGPFFFSGHVFVIRLWLFAIWHMIPHVSDQAWLVFGIPLHTQIKYTNKEYQASKWKSLNHINEGYSCFYNTNVKVGYFWIHIHSSISEINIDFWDFWHTPWISNQRLHIYRFSLGCAEYLLRLVATFLHGLCHVFLITFFRILSRLRKALTLAKNRSISFPPESQYSCPSGKCTNI